MSIHFKSCVGDEDLAAVSLFLLERRHDLHPSFTTMDMVALLYQYITQGSVHCGVDREQRIVGASAYYIGAPEEEFRDRSFALMDIVILDKVYRGSRSFLKGLSYMVAQIAQDHPEIEEIRLAALADNTYLYNMYAKFASPRYMREGVIGQEVVFSEKIENYVLLFRNINSYNEAHIHTLRSEGGRSHGSTEADNQ